ncbi:helix-turn-helix domain-containing protein [Herbiconiux sp. P17]|uniref:helix-turn-helix domain-containing protein n=1 Tax=Herbiconiux wuyangfengii TaxID=3342794 RepID=UPI0035B9AA8D
MTIRDSDIGQNLLTLRGARTQKEIADRMRELGWKWSQATVWAIEKGERSVKLAEAHDLAELLDVDVSDLMLDPGELSLDHAKSEIEETQSRLIDNLKRLYSKEFALARAADAAQRDVTEVEHIFKRSLNVLDRVAYRESRVNRENTNGPVVNWLFDYWEAERGEHQEEA